MTRRKVNWFSLALMFLTIIRLEGAISTIPFQKKKVTLLKTVVVHRVAFNWTKRVKVSIVTLNFEKISAKSFTVC